MDLTLTNVLISAGLGASCYIALNVWWLLRNGFSSDGPSYIQETPTIFHSVGHKDQLKWSYNQTFDYTENIKNEWVLCHSKSQDNILFSSMNNFDNLPEISDGIRHFSGLDISFGIYGPHVLSEPILILGLASNMVILGAGMYQHIYLLNCFLLQDVSGVVENDGSFWDWQFKRIGQINLPNKWGIPWQGPYSATLKPFDQFYLPYFYQYTSFLPPTGGNNIEIFLEMLEQKEMLEQAEMQKQEQEASSDSSSYYFSSDSDNELNDLD